MTLDESQAKSIKEQLFKYIGTLPREKQDQLRKYIESLDNKQLEEFLIKNKMLQEGEQFEAAEGEKPLEPEKEKSKPKTPEEQCIYCLISSKKVEALALYENKDYLGVLEINPLSEGHTLVIPKKHIKETKSLKSKAFTVANKIGKHIIKKLEAENFQVNSSNELGHAIINIVPIYKDKKLTGERKPADKQKLQELAIKIGEVKDSTQKKNNSNSKATKANSKEIKKSGLLQLPRRIP